LLYYGDGGYYSGGAQRGKRALPAEYDKGKYVYKGTYKINGDSSGYVEITQEESEEWQETSASETGYEGGSVTFKFFDFSNTNKLFLGGAGGCVEKWEYKNDTTTVTKKYNGSINFKGAFEGKVVFDNISNVLKYRYIEDHDHHDHDEDGNCMHDTISKDMKGSFYVESGGQKINLPISSLWRFIDMRSDKDYDYGDDKITLNTNVAVPAAPTGTLSDRAGNNAEVNADNVSKFFEAFNAEFEERYNAPRAANEESGNWEKLTHGKASGYVLNKYDYKSQVDNSGYYEVETGTMAYFDYSNKGRLYFGGGFGKLDVWFNKHPNNTGYTNKDTTTINGKVKFNGEFAGTLDFQSFKYEYKYENGNENYVNEYKLIGGKVMIGALDVTEKYLEEVIRRN